MEGYFPSSDLPRHLPATLFSLSCCCLGESEGSFDQQGGGGCGTPSPACLFQDVLRAIKVPFHRLVIAGTRLLSWHRGHIKASPLGTQAKASASSGHSPQGLPQQVQEQLLGPAWAYPGL